MSTILIGVDDSPRSEDAVAFAQPLAASSGATLVVACAFADDETLAPVATPEYRAALEKAAEQTIHRVATRLDGIEPERIRTLVVAASSPARALAEVAESEGADLVVVGSTRTGRLGRIVPGSTGERLLHGAPCPVAIVPAGYRPRYGSLTPRIGIAYDASKESAAALHLATEIALALGGRLRVIRVFDATAYAAPALMGGPGYVEMRATIEQDVQEALERAVAGLPEEVHAVPVFRAGDVAHHLAAQSKDLDLLIAGSRGYGPLRSVLVGGVTGRLSREADCPLIIVPLGRETALGAFFSPMASAAAS